MQLSRFNSIVRQVLALPVLLLALVAVALYWQIHTSIHTVDRIQSSDAAISQANRIGELIIDQETGVRGYEATGDPRFLDPYIRAGASLPGAFAALSATLLDVDEKQRVAKLRADHEVWEESFARPVIATIGGYGGNNVNVHDIDLNLGGKQLMDTVRGDVSSLVAASEVHRARRVERWHNQVHRMLGALGVSALAIGLLIGVFTRSRLHLVSDAYESSLNSLRSQTREIFLSEQQLRTTLASIGDGVITCDTEGRVLTMNHVACELTGWTQEDALNQPLETVFNIINEETREPVENPAAKVKRLDRVVGLANHTILIRKDGTELNIDESGAPIRDQHGKQTGIVLVFRDVTLKKRTQATLIANEKLAVAGRLAASIAHEIHNPLDSVVNLLYLMSSGSTAEEKDHFLALAQQELSRVTQISRAMLSLYRESTAPVPVDVKETLESVLLLLDHRVHDLDAVVTTELPPSLTILGFPAELRQVFTNLIVNAVEAAGPNGNIEIRAQHIQAEGGTERREEGVLIEVADNGAGIPEAALPNLFQPFFSTKGEHGTGLGLWVSQGIIRKHGGTLNLENRPGTHGALARVFLASQPVISAGAD